MNILFKDILFSDQLKRTLGYTAHKGADIGECFATAATIKNGNGISWYQQWYQLANRIARQGDSSKTHNNLISAYNSYLRASSYYRTSYFFLRQNLNDQRLIQALKNSYEHFEHALNLAQDYHARPIEIPFEDTSLPGYWFTLKSEKKARPTLICLTGYDGTAQELFLSGVSGALARGYNCLALEGPGQGRMLIERGKYMRPDWESIITPVIDHLIEFSEVDSSRIALMGRSLGGYFAARAATREHRIAALITDPGMLDIGQRALALVPSFIAKAYKNKQKTLINAFFSSLFRVNKKRSFFFKSRMVTHAVETAYDYIDTLQQYTLTKTARDITCPTLVCDNESEQFSQAQEFYELLTCPKKYILFTEAQGAGDHCEFLAPLLFEQQVFDWLDQKLIARK